MKGLIVLLVVAMSLVTLANSEGAFGKAMSIMDGAVSSVFRFVSGSDMISAKVTDAASLNLTSKGKITFDTFPVGERDALNVGFGDAKAAVLGMFVPLRIVSSGKPNNHQAVVRHGEKLTLVLSQVVDFAAFEVGPLPEDLIVNFFVKEAQIQKFAMSDLRSLFSSGDFSPADVPAQLKTLSFECPKTACAFNKMEIINNGTYNLVIDNFMIGFENFLPTTMIETEPDLVENAVYIPRNIYTGVPFPDDANKKGNKDVKSPNTLPIAIGASVGGVALLAALVFGGKVAVDKKKKKGSKKLILVGAEFGGTADDVENFDTDDKSDIGDDEEFVG